VIHPRRRTERRAFRIFYSPKTGHVKSGFQGSDTREVA
jgi:hypothetical protein